MMLISVIVNPVAVYLSPGRKRLPTMFVVLLGAAAVIASVPLWPSAYILPVMCLFQACHLGSYAVSEAAMLERVAPAVRGRVIGIFITIAGTIAATSPWVMGAWTDALGAKAADPRAYMSLFGLLAVLLVVASYSVFLIRKLGPAPEHSDIEPITEIAPATLEVAG
jgi:MFS family permease